jgi:hypothetical protein
VVFAPNVQNALAPDDELIATCLVLNTSLAQFFFDLSAGASHEGKARDYSQGKVGRLPVSEDIITTIAPLIEEARAVFGEIVQLQNLDPTSVYYCGLSPKRLHRTDALDEIVTEAALLQQRLISLLDQATEFYGNSIGLS